MSWSLTPHLSRMERVVNSKAALWKQTLQMQIAPALIQSLTSVHLILEDRIIKSHDCHVFH